MTAPVADRLDKGPRQREAIGLEQHVRAVPTQQRRARLFGAINGVSFFVTPV